MPFGVGPRSLSNATINTMLDTLTHRWLKIPYTLNVTHIQRPKKPRATVLFIHGIGNSGSAWDEVINGLPEDIRVLSIDLLGFGASPRPDWAVYNAKTQARSVLATYFKLGIASPVVIVGHSLGSLVAIEIAKRYPLLVKSLILCSPPLYTSVEKTSLLPSSDLLLKQLYKSAYDRPDEFVKLSAIAMRYELINKSFNVTADNVDSYMATLEAMIINQTSLQDAKTIKVPTTIIRGTLDPLIVAKNLKELARVNGNVTLETIIAGHEVKGRYVSFVIEQILKSLPAGEKRAKNKT